MRLGSIDVGRAGGGWREGIHHLVRSVDGSLRESHLAGNVGGSEVHLGRVTRDERSVSSSLLLGEDLVVQAKEERERFSIQ